VAKASSYWCAVQTQPNREALAALNLDRQGFEVFFPRRLRTVRHARRLQHRLVGYFPGYLFVRLNAATDPWRSVNGTFGVRNLVMCGDRPARAPDALIDFLRDHAGADGFIKSLQDFAPGDRVKVLSGPFADVIGTLERVEGAGRVRILMELIGGRAPVVTETANLVLAS